MPKQIYIIDDQPDQLELMDLLLRELNKEWRVHPFSSPHQLMEAVQQAPPHLVLADDMMPEMRGSELLDRVRQVSPQTVRVLISGYIVKAGRLSAAHQYVAKPLRGEEILQRLECALEAQEALEDSNLGCIVSRLQSFPVVPTAAAKLLKILDDNQADLSSVAELLNQDAGIFTKLMQMANSPMFGTGEVKDSQEALLKLGTASVRGMVLSLHIFQSYEKITFPPWPVRRIWSHCLNTANLAQNAARLGGLPPMDCTHAHFAGLVHELGRLILIDNRPDDYLRVCQNAAGEEIALTEAERNYFGTTHMDLAAFMLRLWGVPSIVSEAVQFQESPWQSSRRDVFTPVTALYIADCAAQDGGFVHAPVDLDYLKALDAENIARQITGSALK